MLNITGIKKEQNMSSTDEGMKGIEESTSINLTKTLWKNHPKLGCL